MWASAVTYTAHGSTCVCVCMRTKHCCTHNLKCCCPVQLGAGVQAGDQPYMCDVCV